MHKLSSTIRLARERTGLTLTDAAERLGISKTALWRMETGNGRVSMEKLVTIANGYGVSPGSLLDGTIQVPVHANDLGLVARVIEMVLQASHDIQPPPEPTRLAATVVEVIKLAQEDRAQDASRDTDPSRYAGVIRASLGQ